MICAPNPNHFSSLKRLWKEAFDDTDEFIDSFFKVAFSPLRCRVYVEDDAVLAMLFWFDCELEGEKTAYLYAIATAKDMRGQGLCHSLMDKTHKDLKEAGYSAAILVPANNKLFGFYGAMGYLPFGSIETLSVDASNDKVYLKEIKADEYARLRRSYLPQGAVIEEGVCLDFLSVDSQFYKGEDFLLAAKTKKDELIGIELLGNTSRASSIVSSLSCKHGVIRTVGKDGFFAMYLPLKNIKAPKYFGLPFDI
jgi:ribosomal protein S18 acetylase RimI-like enzyme